ncbi:phosphotransferase [Nonomuraea sp. NPDC050786]|uniref:phosphotransferase n=1 Tax=Nonomuraea sp. NPDC050786 TaxID=3154840 RepID=UPI0033E0D905
MLAHHELPPAELRMALTALTGNPTDFPADVEVRAIAYPRWHETTAGVYHVTVPANGAEMVAKVLAKGDGHPSAWPYWRREALAYRSGSLPADELRSPRLLHVTDQAHDRMILWLEYVPHAPMNGATPATLARVATLLGRYHGRLIGSGFTDPPWSSRPRHEYPEYTDKIAPIDLLAEPAVRSDPAVRAAYAPHELNLALVARRALPALAAVWEQAPRVLSHRDFVPLNVMAPDDAAEVVVIDWGQAGGGPAGEDLASMIYTLAWQQRWSAATLAEVEDSCLARYTGALAASCPDLDIAAVCRAYRISTALHTGLLIGRDVARRRDHAWRASAGPELPWILAARAASISRALVNIQPIIDRL